MFLRLFFFLYCKEIQYFCLEKMITHLMQYDNQEMRYAICKTGKIAFHSYYLSKNTTHIINLMSPNLVDISF